MSFYLRLTISEMALYNYLAQGCDLLARDWQEALKFEEQFVFKLFAEELNDSSVSEKRS